jgi:hypothetical protein
MTNAAPRYQDLIARLSEPSPDFTDEERAVFAAAGDRLARLAFAHR